MAEEFIKHFTLDGTTSLLPDAGYWLSREELILTYLHQRGAKVPKVNIKNITQKSLLMEDVGKSLFVEFTSNERSREFIYVNRKILLSIKALCEIFNLGVLHLDIALRNIATPGKANDEIYILDFVHCLSVSNNLQKPLPLLPVEKLHHPLLYKALKQDWEEYFSHLGKSQPVLDKTLELSNQEFSRYWSNSISVQSLSNHLAILCQGVGNLLEEVADTILSNRHEKSIYLHEAKLLKNLDEDQADTALKLAISKLENLNNSNVANLIIDDLTPIPMVKDFGNASKIEAPRTKKLSLYSSFIQQFRYSQVLKKYQIAKLITWCLLILNAVWINQIISIGSIILNDWLLLLVIINLIATPVALTLDFFSKKKPWLITANILINLFILTEILLIFSFPARVFAHLWLWVPSVFIIVIIAIFTNRWNRPS